MEEPTEKDASYSGYPTESSSSVTNSGESVGETRSHDLPPGFKQFECDSAVPAGFKWCTCDLFIEECCTDVRDLLMEEMQRKCRDSFVKILTKDYLKWSCCPPGYLPGLHVGIWDVSSRQLVAFIAAIPIRVRVMEESSRMVQIRFSASRKDFRDRIPANIIHEEVIRRIRSENIRWVVKKRRTYGPAPMAFPVWQRPLNSSKLFKLGIFKNTSMTLPEIAEFHELPRLPDIRGFKGMNASHVKPLTSLLNAYLRKFNIAPEFDEKEVKHWFLPKTDLLHSYVYVRPDGNITGFCSFITFWQLRKDCKVKLAFSFYNFTVGMSLHQLMKDAIIVARENDCDSFFACDIMSNRSFLTELLFFPTRLHFQYNFNLDGIHCLNTDDIGLMLL